MTRIINQLSIRTEKNRKVLYYLFEMFARSDKLLAHPLSIEIIVACLLAEESTLDIKPDVSLNATMDQRASINSYFVK